MNGNRDNDRAYHFETLQLHAGQGQPDPATGARAVPIYQTAAYVFDNCEQAADRFELKESGNIYGRLTNPTQEVLEERVAALEGGTAALATASGAAAITYAVLALAKAGDHVVAQKTIYGGTYNLLAHTLADYGIETSFVDIHDLQAVEAALRGNTKCIFIETLGNPNSDIPDISAAAEIAHKHGIPLVIDNTFGTPYLIRPIEHGADIVVHSATKFIGGLKLFSLLANVADTKSLVIHPASTTHSQCAPEELLEQGIRPNTIRLSVGIENGEDLIAALEAAFRDAPY